MDWAVSSRLIFIVNDWWVVEKSGASRDWLILIDYLLTILKGPLNFMLHFLLLIVVVYSGWSRCVDLSLREGYKTLKKRKLVLWVNKPLYSAAEGDLGEIEWGSFLEKLLRVWSILICCSGQCFGINCQLIPGINVLFYWLLLYKPLFCPSWLPVHYIFAIKNIYNFD